MARLGSIAHLMGPDTPIGLGVRSKDEFYEFIQACNDNDWHAMIERYLTVNVTFRQPSEPIIQGSRQLVANLMRYNATWKQEMVVNWAIYANDSTAIAAEITLTEEFTGERVAPIDRGRRPGETITRNIFAHYDLDGQQKIKAIRWLIDPDSTTVSNPYSNMHF